MKAYRINVRQKNTAGTFFESKIVFGKNQKDAINRYKKNTPWFDSNIHKIIITEPFTDAELKEKAKKRNCSVLDLDFAEAVFGYKNIGSIDNALG